MSTRRVEVTPPNDWPFSELWGAIRLYCSAEYRAAIRRPEPGFRATLRKRWTDQPSTPHREDEAMGRLLTAIPTSAPVVVEVPAEVAKELDELYSYMVEHPEFMAQATFTKDDAEGNPTEDADPDAATTFLAQAKAWGAARTDTEGKPAPLEVRKSPSRTLPDHVIRFNIRPPLTPEEVAANKAKNEAAAAKREADKAKEAKGTSARK